MANLNKVLLMGRLTRDPEMRSTPGGLAICAFGMAVNRYRKGADGERIEDVAFVDVTAFGRQGETIGQYLSRGSEIFIEGHLNFEKWQAQDGTNRTKLGVIVDSFQFVGGRGDNEVDQGQGSGGQGYQGGGYGQGNDGGDIPF